MPARWHLHVALDMSVLSGVSYSGALFLPLANALFIVTVDNILYSNKPGLQYKQYDGKLSL
jgi:hypothetical protein